MTYFKWVDAQSNDLTFFNNKRLWAIKACHNFALRMKKTFGKYLFLLFTVLLSGYHAVYGGSYVQDSGDIFVQNISSSENINYDIQSADLYLDYTGHLGVQDLLFAEIADMEEETEGDKDFASFHKVMGFNGLFSAIAYTCLLAYFCGRLQQNSKHFKWDLFVVPFRSYLRFQVFRI